MYKSILLRAARVSDLWCWYHLYGKIFRFVANWRKIFKELWSTTEGLPLPAVKVSELVKGIMEEIWNTTWGIPQSSNPRRPGFSFFGMTRAFRNNGGRSGGPPVKNSFFRKPLSGGPSLLPLNLLPLNHVIPSPHTNLHTRHYDNRLWKSQIWNPQR